MACSCDLAFGNLGGNPCQDQLGVLARFILVPKTNDAGTVNNFASVAAVTKSALQTKFDAAAIGDRFFATPIFDNVTNERGDTTFWEADSGASYRIKEGVRKITVNFINEGTPFYKNLKKWVCNNKVGFYGVDQEENFIYQQCDGETTVDPIAIEGGTMDVKYIAKTNDAPSMVQLTFDIQLSSDDDKWKFIAADGLDFDGLDVADVYGLQNGNSTYSAIAQTGFTVTLVTDYNTLIPGLIQTDFALYNVNDSASVSISTFTESSTGVYVFTFLSQDVSDVIRVTPTKAVYDFSAVVADTFIVV